MFVDDASSLSDDVFSYDKASERTLKRGYPYSKDPYEYVETATKPRQSRRDSQERFSPLSLTKDVDIGNRQSSDQHLSLRNPRKLKPRRSIKEILERMSRRKDLKRNRQAYENEEFYGL